METEVECEWMLIIRYSYNCRILRIIDRLNINFLYPRQIINHPYNQQILQSMQDNRAIAATDTLNKSL